MSSGVYKRLPEQNSVTEITKNFEAFWHVRLIS